MVCILHFPKIWVFFKENLMMLVSFDAGFAFLTLRLMCLKSTV